MRRVMFCPEKLKYYIKVNGHRQYDIHSSELEDRLAERQKNLRYRDSLNIRWLKFAVRASDDVKENGDTDGKGSKRYYFHTILKEFPEWVQSYHNLLHSTSDSNKAREMLEQTIQETTNNVSALLNSQQLYPESVSKMTEFTLSLSWFEYQNSPSGSTELDKMMSFLSSYNNPLS